MADRPPFLLDPSVPLEPVLIAALIWVWLSLAAIHPALGATTALELYRFLR